MRHRSSRREFVTTASLATSGLLLSGCQQMAESPTSGELLRLGERLTMSVQRILLARRPLVREFSRDQISAFHPTTGTVMPPGDEYKGLLEANFANWRLRIGGLVRQPLALSLPQLRNLPSRTQITQHLCDEGWTAIGQWTGVQVGRLIEMAGLAPDARYVVFHCLDDVAAGGGGYYYESLDLFDAFHPQTILSYDMNGGPLPVRHGAPLRLRAELHIGYKNAKYVDRIELVESLRPFGRGKGSYWADRGYQWYASM